MDEKRKLIEQILELQRQFQRLQGEAECLQSQNNELQFQFAANLQFVRNTLEDIRRIDPELISKLKAEQNFDLK